MACRERNIRAHCVAALLALAVHSVWSAPVADGRLMADSLITALRSSPGNFQVLESMRKAKVPELPARLKEEFRKEDDERSKAGFARALVLLGESDTAYFGYLVELANRALREDPPLPFRVEGACIGGKEVPNPEFRKWWKSSGLDSAAAVRTAMMDAPQRMMGLASLGDPRSAPTLLDGLKARNALLASFAAKGLALIGKKEFIERIVEACEKRDPCERGSLAKALLYFDDPAASAAAAKFIQPKEILDAYRAEKERLGRKALFGF